MADLPPITVSDKAISPPKRSIVAETERRLWDAYGQKESIKLGKVLGIPPEKARNLLG